jgi:LysM repeat protein
MRNNRKDFDTRKSRQKLEQSISVGIIVLLVLMLCGYWVMDDEYDKFIERNNIEYLLDQRAYEVVKDLLTAAIKDSTNQPIRDDLFEKLEEVKQKIKVEKPSQYFGLFCDKMEAHRRKLQFDTALVQMNIALIDSNFSKIEQTDLKNMITRYADDRSKLEQGEKISIPTDYVIKKGETLNGIAYRHNMTPSELRSLSKLENDVVKEGQIIRVYVNVTFKEHIVKSGENLTLIAEKYKIPITKLKKLNDLKSDHLHSGQKIKIGLVMEAEK